jgi:pimeloyl-ACP methyl ester carboxylesterase
MKHQSTFSNIIKVSLILAGVLLTPVDSRSQNSPAQLNTNKIIIIGFVGGLRSPEDINQGVVQIRNRLRDVNCTDLQVSTFSHFHWRKTYTNIVQAIDLDRDGILSDEELRQAPKIIIIGHSLGGWAVIKLARRLEKASIPIELTVQLDSVGIGDEVIPGNVKFAINYYQRNQWPIRGEKRIRAENVGSTNIINNILIQNVRHEALARNIQISDFITDKVLALCQK